MICATINETQVERTKRYGIYYTLLFRARRSLSDAASHKKEHDFNKDMWIGVGGHFEENESPDECLLREVKEETGLTLTSYKMRGILTFVYRDICEYVCLYTADGFEEK